MSVDLKPAVDDLREDLHSAMMLREQFFAREFDRGFIAEGGRIIYAIDSTILHNLFASPEREKPKPAKGPRVQNPVKARYRIFVGPRSETDLRERCERGEKRLGAIASRYVLDGLGAEGQAPLLLLPGHDIEVGNLYDSIARTFARQREKLSEALAQVRHAEKLRDRVSESPGTREEDQARYDAVLEQLFDILYQIQEPHEQFHLFNRFTREARFLTLPVAANHKRFQHADLRRHGRPIFTTLLALEDELRGAEEQQGFAQWWDENLNDALPRMFRGNDKYALNALDLLNRALRPHRMRVVLYTLNDLIIEQGASYLPFAYSGEERETLRGASFADLYLRHARCLLSDPELTRPTAGDGGEASLELVGFLDTMLNVVLEQWHRIRENLGNAPGRVDVYGNWLLFTQSLWLKERRKSSALTDVVLEKALRARPDMHVEFISRWAKYVEDLTASHSAGATRAAQDDIRSSTLVLGESGKDLEGAINRIRDWVSKLTEESWSDFFITAAGTGLELLKVTTGRSAPLVWPMPQLVVRGVGAWRTMLTDLWGTDDVKRSTDQLMAKVTALGAGQANGYVRALGYGVIFSAVSRWHLTRLLAQRAIQIAAEIAQEGSQADVTLTSEQIDGREAFYLAAIAARVAGEFAEAREALSKAESCLATEEARAAEAPVLTGLRFAVERREIEAGEINFAIDQELLARGKKVSAALSAPLRQRIQRFLAIAATPLAEEKDCLEPAICQHARLARRSLYFQALAHTAEGEGRRIDKSIEALGLTDAFATIVAEQVTEVRTAYKDLRWLPLRDRVLLQVGARAARSWDVLDSELQRSFTEIGALVSAGEFKFSGVERRFLSRMEALADLAKR